MLWNFIIMNIFVGLIASAFEAIRDDKNTIRTDSASKCLVCRCGLGRGWPTLGQARNERFCLTWVGWEGGGQERYLTGQGHSLTEQALPTDGPTDAEPHTHVLIY